MFGMVLFHAEGFAQGAQRFQKAVPGSEDLDVSLQKICPLALFHRCEQIPSQKDTGAVLLLHLFDRHPHVAAVREPRRPHSGPAGFCLLH